MNVVSCVLVALSSSERLATATAEAHWFARAVVGACLAGKGSSWSMIVGQRAVVGACLAGKG